MPLAPPSPPVTPPESAAVEAIPNEPAPFRDIASERAHTDLSAMLPTEAPFKVPTEAPSANPRLPMLRHRSRTLLGSALGLLLLCTVLLLARGGDRVLQPLKAGAAARARPTIALVNVRLQRAAEENAERARQELQKRAQQQAELAGDSRVERKRPRARRWARSARSRVRAAPRVAPPPANDKASERTASAPSQRNSATPPRAKPTRPFDISRATRALNASVGRARSCGQGSALQKSVLATVTFDPSGRVKSVRVGAPLSRTRAGSCVAGALRSTRVPPFQGNPVTISRRVNVSSSARASR
ncbi:MAG TPA: hypothetical protein VK524_17915 [Polyangiaceae bacterium]|nr:hypothetical protein [Polyangiaceae bacterium]